MSVVMFHATPRRNIKSIMKSGLLISKSTGKRPAVWLHSGECSGWAIEHCASRHGVDQGDVVVLRVVFSCIAAESYSDHKLRRHGLSGMMYTLADVPPAWITECSYLQGREWRGADYAH